jgi:hypothetical protein
MQFKERYAVQKKSPDGFWFTLHVFHECEERKALEYMERAAIGSGSWKVVRTTEVTLATFTKA